MAPPSSWRREGADPYSSGWSALEGNSLCNPGAPGELIRVSETSWFYVRNDPNANKKWKARYCEVEVDPEDPSPPSPKAPTAGRLGRPRGKGRPRRGGTAPGVLRIREDVPPQGRAIHEWNLCDLKEIEKSALPEDCAMLFPIQKPQGLLNMRGAAVESRDEEEELPYSDAVVGMKVSMAPYRGELSPETPRVQPLRLTGRITAISPSSITVRWATPLASGEEEEEQPRDWWDGHGHPVALEQRGNESSTEYRWGHIIFALTGNNFKCEFCCKSTQERDAWVRWFQDYLVLREIKQMVESTERKACPPAASIGTLREDEINHYVREFLKAGGTTEQAGGDRRRRPIRAGCTQRLDAPPNKGAVGLIVESDQQLSAGLTDSRGSVLDEHEQKKLKVQQHKPPSRYFSARRDGVVHVHRTGGIGGKKLEMELRLSEYSIIVSSAWDTSLQLKRKDEKQCIRLIPATSKGGLNERRDDWLWWLQFVKAFPQAEAAKSGAGDWRKETRDLGSGKQRRSCECWVNKADGRVAFAAWPEVNLEWEHSRDDMGRRCWRHSQRSATEVPGSPTAAVSSGLVVYDFYEEFFQPKTETYPFEAPDQQQSAPAPAAAPTSPCSPSSVSNKSRHWKTIQSQVTASRMWKGVASPDPDQVDPVQLPGLRYPSANPNPARLAPWDSDGGESGGIAGSPPGSPTSMMRSEGSFRSARSPLLSQAGEGGSAFDTARCRGDRSIVEFPGIEVTQATPSVQSITPAAVPPMPAASRRSSVATQPSSEPASGTYTIAQAKEIHGPRWATMSPEERRSVLHGTHPTTATEDAARVVVYGLPNKDRLRGQKQVSSERWQTMTWTERLRACEAALGVSLAPAPSPAAAAPKAAPGGQPGEGRPQSNSKVGKALLGGLRNGRLHQAVEQMEAELGGGDAPQQQQHAGAEAAGAGPRELDIVLRLDDPRGRLGVRWEGSEAGVVVQSLDVDSAGARAGLRTGMLLLRAFGKPIETKEQLLDALRRLRREGVGTFGLLLPAGDPATAISPQREATGPLSAAASAAARPSLLPPPASAAGLAAAPNPHPLLAPRAPPPPPAPAAEPPAVPAAVPYSPPAGGLLGPGRPGACGAGLLPQAAPGVSLGPQAAVPSPLPTQQRRQPCGAAPATAPAPAPGLAPAPLLLPGGAERAAPPLLPPPGGTRPAPAAAPAAEHRPEALPSQAQPRPAVSLLPPRAAPQPLLGPAPPGAAAHAFAAAERRAPWAPSEGAAPLLAGPSPPRDRGAQPLLPPPPAHIDAACGALARRLPSPPRGEVVETWCYQRMAARKAKEGFRFKRRWCSCEPQSLAEPAACVLSRPDDSRPGGLREVARIVADAGTVVQRGGPGSELVLCISRPGGQCWELQMPSASAAAAVEHWLLAAAAGSPRPQRANGAPHLDMRLN